MRFDTLPDKLIKDALWCVWKYEDRDGKRTKVPYNPRTGGRAQSNNPATFSDFKTAVAAFGRCQYDGMGIGVGGLVGQSLGLDHDDGVLTLDDHFRYVVLHVERIGGLGSGCACQR